MLGDDPDPSVMTERVGFGTASDTHTRGFVHCIERLQFRQEGKRRTRLVFERSTKAGGCRNYERMQVLKTMMATSADAMQMMS